MLDKLRPIDLFLLVVCNCHDVPTGYTLYGPILLVLKNDFRRVLCGPNQQLYLGEGAL